MTARVWLIALLLTAAPATSVFGGGKVLPGTRALALTDQVVDTQRQQVTGYFLRRIAQSERIRAERMQLDFISRDAYEKSAARHRRRCRTMLGLVEPSAERGPASLQPIGDVPGAAVERLTIPITAGLSARGLLFLPPADRPRPLVIACPDADQWPERFAGLLDGAEPPGWLRAMTARGAAVYIPQSIERTTDHPYCQTTNSKDRRMVLYRLGYVVGRTMPGLDVRDILAALDALLERDDIDSDRVGIAGIGQGGMAALFAAAVDRRITAVVVGDYFQDRSRCWQEPVDRRLPAQLLQFGDAELAALIAPRPLAVIRSADGLVPQTSFLAEARKAARIYDQIDAHDKFTLVPDPAEPSIADRAFELVAKALALPDAAGGGGGQWHLTVPAARARALRDRHFEERLAYLRRLVDDSEAQRERRWNILGRPATEFSNVQTAMLDDYRSLVGQVLDEKIPLDPRTELALITASYKAYRVTLQVVAGVEVYGNLLIPREVQRRAPAVICQHGLSGTPEMITGLGQKEDTPYHQFGRHLAERGYVVFAPLLLHHHPVERLNAQVRQADAVGMMRIAMPIAKTRRVIEFLTTLPQVDRDRIGYYGLSYGGYSAIWMAPLLERLAPVVISGHFNDWRQKITSVKEATSYLRHPDEDFYNWDILHRFTHPELIAMIAPRPVCVEYGTHDGITTPRWTASAWRQVAAIRAHLGLATRIELARYDGVHEVHGVATFDFVDRFLRPEHPVGRDYQYTLRRAGKARTGPGGQLIGGEPFVTHDLEADPGAAIRGRFPLPAGAKQFRGMAVKLSRVGHPGAIEARFGTAPGRDDVGVAALDSAGVLPLFEQWYRFQVPGRSVKEGTLIHYELRCTSGAEAENRYVVFGPRPIGGEDFPDRFALSYRVLTDRPVDAVDTPGKEHPYAFVREMLGPYTAGRPPQQLPQEPAAAAATRIGDGWTIWFAQDDNGVLETAAADLQAFLASRLAARVRLDPARSGQVPRAIELVADRAASRARGVTTAEGYHVDVRADRIVISGQTPRGVMRGVFWLEEILRFQPALAREATLRNCRFKRRITCSVMPGGLKYTETSQPLLYTDGLLQRIAHQGFNAIWVWLNVEEATFESRIFPELNDKAGATRCARLADLTARARRFGIDVYCYFATNYHHPVPESFYAAHPDARGVGYNNAMCSSNDQVRAYYAETVANLFRHVPALKGLIVIFDSEGFFYCGNSDNTRRACPRCKESSCEQLALQLLTTLNDAVHTGGADRELVAWPYSTASGDADSWVLRLTAKLPQDILFQAGFSKGSIAEKDGIRHVTGDYNISTIGPPAQFVRAYTAARRAGLTVMAKTEHAISQEFITVPYIPCLQQWYRRIEKMAQYELGGFLANWCHYGYTPSPPAEIMMWYSWTGAPPIDTLLLRMARRDYGPAAATHVVAAWSHFTRGIQHFPYSDPVARTPGPLQKGPSQPLLLDPAIKSFGPWRSWQNDLKWTRPWGPAITAKYLGLLEQEFAAGCAELRRARREPSGAQQAALDRELGAAETIRRSVHTILNLIEWIPVRDAYAAAAAGPERDALRAQLLRIARDELANARAALLVVQADSRLGASSAGVSGLQRGGLFTPALIRYKIGLLEDVLDRQLADPPKGVCSGFAEGWLGSGCQSRLDIYDSK